MTYLCKIKFFELFFVKKVTPKSDFRKITRKIESKKTSGIVKTDLCKTVLILTKNCLYFYCITKKIGNDWYIIS